MHPDNFERSQQIASLATPRKECRIRKATSPKSSCFRIPHLVTRQLPRILFSIIAISRYLIQPIKSRPHLSNTQAPHGDLSRQLLSINMTQIVKEVASEVKSSAVIDCLWDSYYNPYTLFMSILIGLRKLDRYAQILRYLGFCSLRMYQLQGCFV